MTYSSDEDEPCFMDYWNACDAALLKLYGLDTMDIDLLTADMIAGSEEDGWTPEEFALWCGGEFKLKAITDA